MRKLLFLAMFIGILFLFIGNVSAECPSGELCIFPHGSYFPYPEMLSSPATFTIESANSTTAVFPNIVLVMTKASYESLSGPIIVTWVGTSGQSNQSIFPKASFQAATTGYIPDKTVTPYDTGRYNVSDLKMALGVNGTDQALYYVFGPFLGGSPIGRIPREFTVNLPSNQGRMLVLAVARSGVCAAFFNVRVGPCKPGFVVPEPTPIFMATASLAALGLFTVKRRKR